MVDVSTWVWLNHIVTVILGVLTIPLVYLKIQDHRAKKPDISLEWVNEAWYSPVIKSEIGNEILEPDPKDEVEVRRTVYQMKVKVKNNARGTGYVEGAELWVGDDEEVVRLGNVPTRNYRANNHKVELKEHEPEKMTFIGNGEPRDEYPDGLVCVIRIFTSDETLIDTQMFQKRNDS